MITIKGIRIDALTIARKENGDEEITASYVLLSSTDKVLAKQEVGGYNGLKVQPSASTVKAFNDAITAYKADVNMVLGLDAS